MVVYGGGAQRALLYTLYYFIMHINILPYGLPKPKTPTSSVRIKVKPLALANSHRSLRYSSHTAVLVNGVHIRLPSCFTQFSITTPDKPPRRTHTYYARAGRMHGRQVRNLWLMGSTVRPLACMLLAWPCGKCFTAALRSVKFPSAQVSLKLQLVGSGPLSTHRTPTGIICMCMCPSGGLIGRGYIIENCVK